VLIVSSSCLQEFFESFVREIKQCCSGERVEKIEGDQKKKAIYTLLAPEGTGECIYVFGVRWIVC
jgi:hypothetical protein